MHLQARVFWEWKKKEKTVFFGIPYDRFLINSDFSHIYASYVQLQGSITSRCSKMSPLSSSREGPPKEQRKSSLVTR